MAALEDSEAMRIDFAALRVLATVHRLCSIRAAADELDMSQSSVSYTIDRLRRSFGDPLFVRLGRGIEPTARCTAIAKGADDLLRRFEGMMAAEDFDPALSGERFVLSCNFYERAIFLPALMKRVRAAAPNVRIAVIQANSEGHRQLESGECDVVIAPLTAEMSGLHSERLLLERYACFVAADGRFAREKLTLEEYAAAQHIFVRHASNWRPYYRAALDRLGVSTLTALEMPSFGNVDSVIAASDLILTASEGFTRIFASRVKCVPAPFDCDFPVQMSWAGRTHASAPHLWFRDLIRSIAVELRRETRSVYAP